jgi:hypothetical protein
MTYLLMPVVADRRCDAPCAGEHRHRPFVARRRQVPA